MDYKPGPLIRPIETFENLASGPLSEEDKALHALGVMKTIYVPVHPLVNRVKMALGAASAETVEMFQSPHMRRQDKLHERFFEVYINWSRAAVNLQGSDYPHQYPTSGSNEAIRETIAYHASQCAEQGRDARLHIFEGEYEGYRAHAESHGVTVITHARDDFEASLELNFKAGEPFYLSAPSGIDGDIWAGYEAFLTHLEDVHPTCRLMVDLAYLNTTARIPQIRTDSPVIDAIFISMSKSFPGTYYDRIGGVFSKRELPGLFGNKWFKNLGSLLLGVNLMQQSALGDLPAEMSVLQRRLVKRLQPVLGEDLRAADVTFVATQPMPERPTDVQALLNRAGQVRYCLTPGLTELLYP
jgi:hypothetical protein